MNSFVDENLNESRNESFDTRSNDVMVESTFEQARTAVFAIAQGQTKCGLYASVEPKKIQVIGCQWDNLENAMMTNKDLAEAIAKIPSDILVKILNEATSSKRKNSDQCSLPDAEEASSVPSSSEEDEEEDSFDSSSVPLPRISSSTIPLVMEVAPRSGGFGSKDPLNNSMCLYSGSMSDDQVKEYSVKHSVRSPDICKKTTVETSWFLPTVLRHLLQKQLR